MFNTDYYHSRYFNKIEKQEDILVKYSTNIEKIVSEYNYYYYLPDSLKRFFVQPYDLIVLDNIASYKMECINYKNLAQLFISDNITLNSFNKILDKIDIFKHNTYRENYEEVKKESEYLVIEKTKNRILEFNEYSLLLKRIEDGFNQYLETRTTWNSVLSHGDLCFSNILWIKEIDMIKFIDPRGAKIKSDLYMDEYYDLAKLSHSIFGGYESIIYRQDIKYDHIKELFIEYLISKNISVELLKVYEASLFLSMTPLHIDKKQNVELFIKTCDKILKDLGV